MSMYGTYKIYKNGQIVAEQRNKLTVLGRANALKAMLGQTQYFANSFGIGVSDASNGSDKFLNMTDLGFTVGKYPISLGTLGLGSESSTDGLVYIARITDTSRYNIHEIGLFSNVVTEALEVDDLTIFNFESGDPLKEIKPSFNATISIANPAIITYSSHNLINGDSFKITTTGSLPTGISTGTTYYAIDVTTNNFKLSETKNGSAIVTTGTQSGVHTIIPLDNYYLDDIYTGRATEILDNESTDFTNSNYRIGTNAVKITGADKTIFFDDIQTDLSNINGSDSFTLAAYNSSTGSKTVTLTFLSGSNTATYSFALSSGYNIISVPQLLASNYTALDWSKIDKISIKTPSNSGSSDYIILDGLRVKYNQPVDATDGLVSRAVLTGDQIIEKDAGSIIDIQYILSFGLET